VVDECVCVCVRACVGAWMGGWVGGWLKVGVRVGVGVGVGVGGRKGVDVATGDQIQRGGGAYKNADTSRITHSKTICLAIINNSTAQDSHSHNRNSMLPFCSSSNTY
jgi:hypothetical protein